MFVDVSREGHVLIFIWGKKLISKSLGGMFGGIYRCHVPQSVSSMVYNFAPNHQLKCHTFILRDYSFISLEKASVTTQV